MQAFDQNVREPKVIQFVGRSGSGKTHLLERIIPRIVERGVKVGTIKHHGHSGFDIDVEGKDSWRHYRAGSSHVVIASPDKYASYRDLDEGLSVVEILPEFTDVDLVIVEGYRAGGLPCVIVARAQNPREETDPSNLDGVDLVGCVTDIERLVEEATSRGVPCADIDDTDAVVRMVFKLTGLANIENGC